MLAVLETFYGWPALGSWPVNAIATKVLAPLRKNVLALREAFGLDTDAKLAAKASVSPKTVNNIVNARHGVTVTSVGKVAVPLGVEAWQLFIEDLPDTAPDRRALALIVRAFTLLGAEGRANIRRTAEIETKAVGLHAAVFKANPGTRVQDKRRPPAAA